MKIIQNTSWKQRLVFSKKNKYSKQSILISSDKSLSSTMVFSSTSSTESIDSVDTATFHKDQTFPCSNIVVVNRGRQSMAFRQGSPLVFSGAISHTLQFRNQEDMTIETQPFEIGSLVAIAVNNKESTGAGGGEGEAAREGGNRRKHKNSRSKYGKKKSQEENYPNRVFYTNEATGQMLSSDGSITNIPNFQIIGYGIYNPNSMYRVRILCHETSHPTTFRSVKQLLSLSKSNVPSLSYMNDVTKQAMTFIIETKLEEAIKSRQVLGLSPFNDDNDIDGHTGSQTDSFRLFNGEGDGLSGLAIDILGGNIGVVMSSAAWCEIYKDIIINVLMDVLNKSYGQTNNDWNIEIIWRTTESRLKQDGYNVVSSNLQHSNEGENSKINNSIIATESGIQYKIYPWANGQKTGFYCDQRENRLQMAHLTHNKRVLDLCCYNGGFSLNALKHGAKSCIGVDSSQDAIDAAIENAKINGFEDDKRYTFVRDDISNYMKEMIDRGDTYYDVIILDPPKLAPSVSGLDRASRKYQALNRDAMKLIDPEKGGVLLTCTCSGAMTQKDGGQYFLQTVKAGSLSARRQITLLKTTGAAPCHTQCPASYPAGAYLTAAMFHVSPLER